MATHAATQLLLLLVSFASGAERPGTCDPSCAFAIKDADNITHSYDLHPLCNTTHDYSINDTAGFTFYANICGTAQHNCAPQE